MLGAFFGQLRNLGMSIGPEGSAAHVLAVEFLARAGVMDQKSATQHCFRSPQETSAKLLIGDIGAAVLMGAD